MKYKARDLVQLYREHGAERASLMVNTEIIEYLTAMNEQMNELTLTCNKMIDMMSATAGGYAGLRKEVERIRNKQGEGNES
jgi:hypothetical protein